MEVLQSPVQALPYRIQSLSIPQVARAEPQNKDSLLSNLSMVMLMSFSFSVCKLGRVILR